MNQKIKLWVRQVNQLRVDPGDNSVLDLHFEGLNPAFETGSVTTDLFSQCYV